MRTNAWQVEELFDMHLAAFETYKRQGASPDQLQRVNRSGKLRADGPGWALIMGANYI